MDIALNRSPAQPAANDCSDFADPDCSRVLITEANHRIANNLSMVAALLRMQSADVRRDRSSISRDEAVALIEVASARIDVVAQLHRRFAAGADEDVDLGDYLIQIATGVIESMAVGRSMHLAASCDATCMTDGVLALRIGFIINEMVTNAIKYAHPAHNVPGHIELGCARQPDGSLLVWVADDGVGLPDDFPADGGNGLGMRTMRLLAREIDAALSLESTELGLTASLRLPPTASKTGSGEHPRRG